MQQMFVGRTDHTLVSSCLQKHLIQRPTPSGVQAEPVVAQIITTGTRPCSPPKESPSEPTNSCCCHLFVLLLSIYLFLATLSLCCCAQVFSSCCAQELLFRCSVLASLVVASLVSGHRL